MRRRISLEAKGSTCEAVRRYESNRQWGIGRMKKAILKHCHGAHTEGYNSYIGIRLIENFNSDAKPGATESPIQPTEAQLKAAANLRYLQLKYQIPLERTHYHRDVTKGTECPGDKFPFNDILHILRNSSGASRKNTNKPGILGLGVRSK
jgi:hypothetical protein